MQDRKATIFLKELVSSMTMGGIATYLMAKVQNHRAKQITKVFERTGFFEYCSTLPLRKAEEYSETIDLAPIA